MPGSGSDRGVDPFTCLFMAGAKKVADDKFLSGVNFYVKGVEGKVPAGN
jgi:hypothetical protein